MYIYGRDRIFEPGNFYLIPTGVPFQHISSPGIKHFWFHFTATVFSGYNIFSMFNCPFSVPSADAGDECNRLVSLHSSLNNSPNDLLIAYESDLIIRKLLFLFLSRATVNSESMAAARFKKVFSFISANLERKIEVTELARLLNLNANYFCNLFSATIGVAPRTYILQRRIELAQRLLWETELPLKDICARCGYDDIAYFCRVFKKQTFMTPSEFKLTKPFSQ